MKRTLSVDPVVGQVISFKDRWNDKPADCLLVGTGSGPEGETVRIVGRPLKAGGFVVHYVRSYEQGRGNARQAYEFLARQYGQPISVVEVVSEAGIAFHRRMLQEGVITVMRVDLDGRDPASGMPMGAETEEVATSVFVP